MELILTLLWMHFVADFVLQSDEMALNKSTSVKWLGFHCLVYTLPFTLIMSPLSSVLIFLSHFFLDCVSSRATKFLWLRGERHWFFVVIGLDQAIHLTVLFKLVGGV